MKEQIRKTARKVLKANHTARVALSVPLCVLFITKSSTSLRKNIRNGGNQLCGSIIYAQGLSELALAQAQASVGGGGRRIGRRDADTDDPHELTVRLCVDLHGE